VSLESGLDTATTVQFNVCKSMHHRTIQINQPTRCNIFASLLFDVYMWFNMFRVLSRPSSGAYTALGASGFTVGEWRLECCWSWSVDHDQQRSNRHSPMVKPEAPSAV
jgi:hypothetical protein